MKVKKGLILIEVTLLLTILIVFTISMTEFNNGCENIYDSMLRLHIIANSDSTKDQELKLKVRDEILRTGNTLFDGTLTKENAKKELNDKILLLENSAESVLKSNGCYDKVKITLGKYYFNTRSYENFTVPAGFYDAIKVEIGKAEGRNWWCVMFPPLCLPAVSESHEEVFSQSGNQVLSSDVNLDVRFKIVEIYQTSKNYIKKFTNK